MTRTAVATPKCPPHAFVRGIHGDHGDHCRHCGITWRDWTRGFGTNVRPKRVVR